MAQHALLVIRETWVRVSLKAEANFSDEFIEGKKNKIIKMHCVCFSLQLLVSISFPLPQIL